MNLSVLKLHFVFVNISAPLDCTEMVLYSKFAYGSWFSGEKNDLKILHLVAEIFGKNPVSFFLGHPVYFHCVKVVFSTNVPL